MSVQCASAMFRHEFKYYSPEYMLKELEARVQTIMPRDPHVGAQGAYHIRSMYFDDMHNT